VDAPATAATTPGRARIQAIASWAGEHPSAFAISVIASTTSKHSADQ
jgi:hypothetical protein